VDGLIENLATALLALLALLAVILANVPDVKVLPIGTNAMSRVFVSSLLLDTM
jgi:hypothetical protein